MKNYYHNLNRKQKGIVFFIFAMVLFFLSCNGSDEEKKFFEGIRIEDTELKKPWVSFEDELKKLLKQKIIGYGKIIDQNGKALTNVKVRLSWADKPWESGTKTYVKTDNKGNFSFDGKGGRLLISVNKKGYYPEGVVVYKTEDFPNKEDIVLDEINNTKDNPIVIKLQKRNKTEPLKKIKIRTKIPIDGTKAKVLLTSGDDASSLEIILKADTSKLKNNGDMRPYDWSCKISAPGGGFIRRKHKERLNFIAPEKGYIETLEQDMKKEPEEAIRELFDKKVEINKKIDATAPIGKKEEFERKLKKYNQLIQEEIKIEKQMDEIQKKAGKRWSRDFSGDFFIKLGNGTYARAEIKVGAGYEGGRIFVKGYLNPSGSRNLEWDKEKEIK